MSHAPNAPGKVKTETAQTLTRQVTGAGRGSKVVAGGQAHPRDVDAVLPLILVLQVSHHLQPASRSNTPQARAARLPELPQHRRRQRCSQPPYRQTAPGIAHSQEGVMLAVAKVGCAACQLRPAAVLAMVVGQGAIVHHHRDVREHTLRPRYQLLHSQPHLWEAAGAPTTPIPGGCFCAGTREKSQSPSPGQLPSRAWPALQERAGPTSVVSSLGYVSRKMAKPWKLSLLPNTGPEIEGDALVMGETGVAPWVPEGQSNAHMAGSKRRHMATYFTAKNGFYHSIISKGYLKENKNKEDYVSETSFGPQSLKCLLSGP